MLPFNDYKVSSPDCLCKMKAQDAYLSLPKSKMESEKDDEVIITLEVPSRLDQTIVIPSDSDSDDSDITVLPIEKCKPKQSGRSSGSVVDLDSDDEIFVFDDRMKSMFEGGVSSLDVDASVVVKADDPFLSGGMDDCKVRLFDLDFSYRSSDAKKSESIESATVDLTAEMLDIHAPMTKPVFLSTASLQESDSTVDVLFDDDFVKTPRSTPYSVPRRVSSQNDDGADLKKKSAAPRPNRTTGKRSGGCVDKKPSKDSTSKKSSNPGSSTWSVVSTEKNKVVLRRSPRPTKDNKGGDDSKKRCASSPQICKKKSKQADQRNSVVSSAATDAHDVKSSRFNNKSSDSGASPLPAFVRSSPQEEQSMCYGCKLNFGVSHLSYCMAGHGCCGQCIQIQVKSLLAKGRKGTLKCRYTACNSFYLVSQLRNSLPSMVVEILEEKLDREYCDNAAKLMMQASSHCGSSCVAKDGMASKDGHVCQENLLSDEEEEEEPPKQEPDPNLYPNLPKTWEPMVKTEEYRVVDVCKGSDEYNWVAGLFHQTMTRPRASIIKIKHLQNPILWQYYTVKKTEMERDNSRPVNEKNLFHGTSRKAVEAICRTNFDWRLCGSHGTTYGQGSYFARDAAYSHMYTDQPAVQPHPRHLQAPLSNTILFNTSQSSQISQPAHHHIPAHPHHVGQTPAGQLAHQIIFQTFPGTSHSVSIAALQSCRFARIPVGPPGAPHQQVIIPPAGVPPNAISFGHYWSINGGSGPSSGPQLSQLNRPSANVLHAAASSSAASKQLHGSGQQHHHHNHHLPPGSHLGHHGHHVPPHPPQPDHIHVMFLARVLVGEYTLGKNSYRKPPSKDPSDSYGKSYDACVNDTSNPTIYVIFNSSQCYPEYIVEYTNKPRDM